MATDVRRPQTAGKHRTVPGGREVPAQPSRQNVSDVSSEPISIGLRSLIREAILGYLFWSIFQGIAPMIWFYPLNELEISGYEVFVVTLLSPVFTGIGKVRSLVQSQWVMAVLRLSMLACLGSFQAPTTLHRLIVLSVGGFFAMLVFTGTLWSTSRYNRSLTFWGLMLGLFSFLVSRIWFTTFVPTWWSHQTNSAVIAIGTVATLDKIISGEDALLKAGPCPSPPKPGWFVTGVGFGSLLYVTYAVFGEVSLATRWTVRGFPDTGPMPYPWGALILIALFVGIMGSSVKGFVTSAFWWLVGASGFIGLYFLPTWQAFAGGIVLAMFVMSIWPEMIDRLTACPPGRTLPLATLVMICEILFSVWTVAYNFVPGGVYTREHTGYLVVFVMVTIGLALFTGKSTTVVLSAAQKPAVEPIIKARKATVTGGGGNPYYAAELLKGKGKTAEPPIQKESASITGDKGNPHYAAQLKRLRIAPSSTSVDSHTAFVDLGEEMMPNSYVRALLVLLLVTGLGGFVYRYPRQHFQPPPKVHPKADFTAAIWTYHFGYDNQGWPSLERGARLLNDTGADVITLLESDASKPFLGNNDLGMWLGERLGMYVDFGPSTRDHTWGYVTQLTCRPTVVPGVCGHFFSQEVAIYSSNLILSKYPIVQSTHHLLPSPEGELAPAVTATVNFTGNLVDFLVTHMGNDRDVLDREQQAQFLAKEASQAKNPIVFMGYVTSRPHTRDYKTLTKQGKLKDIDDTDYSRFCEYIMYRGLIRLGYARVSHGGLSDTELQMARWRIPIDHKNYEDHDRLTTDASSVEPSTHFSERFGKYKDGHNYIQNHNFHMSTPKYFIKH